MNIIDARQLTYFHGANLVLDHINFEIREGEKIGLIGRNGSGKTTLMRLLAGLDQPVEGTLAVKKDTRIGYLEQIPSHMENWTFEEVLSFGMRHLKECRETMTKLEQQMSDPSAAKDNDRMERLLRRYSQLQEQFEREGGYEMEATIDRIASGLNISKADDYSQAFGLLSGGEKTRVLLASQLIVQPDLLLLDEPTNHLDLARTEWLESFLQDYAGTCVIISHDRYFLDRVVTRTIELEDCKAYTAAGGYTEYVKEKETRLLQQFAEYQEQQKVIKKMKESIRQLEEWGRVGGNEKFFKRAASMRRAMERMEKIKRPVLDRRQADFDLNPQDRTGRRVVSFEEVGLAFGEQLVLNGVSGLLEYGEKIVLMGANGSGKTTLFRLLLGELMPDFGQVELGARVEAGYLAQEEVPEDPEETVLQYFHSQAGMEEGEARGTLARFLFYGSAVFKKLGGLSGGEWTRLRLAVLIHQKPNLLLLDEPTNHLDIESREALEEALVDYSGTVLAISHDRYFTNRIGSKVWELENGGLTVYLGNYDDYRSKKEQLASAASMGSRMKDGTGKARKAEVTGDHGSRGNGRGTSVHHEQEPGNRNGQRIKRLELEIAELEARIQKLDYEMDKENDAASNASLRELEESWGEREALSLRYERLLSEWLELSS